MNKVVIPVSGGMDSAVILFQACHEYDEVHALVYDYGQRHGRELICASTLIRSARKIKPVVEKYVDLRFIRDIAPTSSLTSDAINTPNVNLMAGEAQPKSYVPFRNMMFLSIALSYAEAVGAKTVLHGATVVDSLAGYWDSSEEFMPALNSLCSLNREHQITVLAPLINANKADIVRLGVKYGVPFKDTYTCYSGGELSDITTPSSSMRVQGFIQAGYKDPLQYIQQDRLNELYIKNGCIDIDTPIY
jgi:7-cyano-7-deazaguanine synthase